MEERFNLVEENEYDNSFNIVHERVIDSAEPIEIVLAYCVHTFQPKGMEKSVYNIALDAATKHDRFNDILRIKANGWYDIHEEDGMFVFETSEANIR